MNKLKYEPEIVQEGNKFVIKIRMEFELFEDASAFGHAVDDIVTRLVEARGGKLVKFEDKTAPRIIAAG